MRYYITNDNVFWNGHGFSPEYPDAKLFPTRGAAYKDILKARGHLGNLRIVDSHAECNCDQSGPIQCDVHGPRE